VAHGRDPARRRTGRHTGDPVDARLYGCFWPFRDGAVADAIPVLDSRREFAIVRAPFTPKGHHAGDPMTLLEKLMPKSDDFFDDFEKLAAATVEGTRLFKALLDDFTDVARKVQAIKDVEHRGDDITHRAFERLHTQFITPFDRSEIHRLLSRIDDVLDLADAATERLGLYEIGTILPDARELAGVLVAAAETMQDALRGLRDVKNPSRVLEACKQVNVYENQGDTLIRRAIADLFKSGLDPLSVMKWKEILDLVEDAIDRAEDVANVIEGVVLEHA
jgi:uncharacterized protein Yka (UPF0111/DUF47 family)